jgi:5-methylthioribose kinase
MNSQNKWFDESSSNEIEQYLNVHRLIDSSVGISSIKKMNGNMNATLLLQFSNGKQWIFKQSRDFVMRFPALDAPVERAITEASFYEFIAAQRLLQSTMTNKIWLHSASYLNIFEVEPESKDGRFLYDLNKNDQKANIEVIQKSLVGIVKWLANLHLVDTTEICANPLFQNREMAEFQRKQLFQSPFESLEQQMKASLIKEEVKVSLWNTVRTANFLLARNGLDQRMMRSTKTLIHGDFFPGNWLFRQNEGYYIIDPEFCFFGPAEYDLGVFLAHLHLAAYPIEKIGPLFLAYQKINPSIDGMLTDSFARFEIIRRLIGLARIPIDENRAHFLLNESIRFFLQ